MKNKRQEMILEIIETMSVETQEELAEILKERNFPVTQATISRDIKELRLIKTLSDKGAVSYTHLICARPASNCGFISATAQAFSFMQA